MNRRIKLVIEYDGTQYHGWQVQSNGISIQEVLQNCLQKITREKRFVIGSGRTDAGVHAQAQVAHFDTESNMTCHQFLMAFNSLLPSDIVIKQVDEVPATFHAQQSATHKIYRYTILNRQYPSALQHNRCLFVQFPLDVDAMCQAVTFLEGKHDFTAFRAGDCEAKNPVREINSIDIKKDGDYINIFCDGNGFLKYMVRNIVGTLIQIGRGKIQTEQIKTILESRDRKNAGPTAKAYGLCLVEVFYD